MAYHVSQAVCIQRQKRQGLSKKERSLDYQRRSLAWPSAHDKEDDNEQGLPPVDDDENDNADDEGNDEGYDDNDDDSVEGGPQRGTLQKEQELLERQVRIADDRKRRGGGFVFSHTLRFLAYAVRGIQEDARAAA